ncbi:MAG: 30S ribosomal protein S9 [Thermoflexales bacterium]|nr:30S ribosomal protein S9 [Thermoflexales bacterium]
MTEQQYYEGIGRRKAATARVRLHVGGTGSVVVNDKPAEEYFTRDVDRWIVLEPLKVTENETRFNVTVLVKGGGVSGQSEAVQMGMARALVQADPELRKALRRHHLLTRDARVKERKKPGLKRARKAPQYTKR